MTLRQKQTRIIGANWHSETIVC